MARSRPTTVGGDTAHGAQSPSPPDAEPAATGELAGPGRDAGRRTRRRLLQALSVLLVVAIFAGVLPQLVDLVAVWRVLTGQLSGGEAVIMAGFTAASLMASFFALMAGLPGLKFRHAALVNVVSTSATYALPAGAPAGAAVSVSMLRSLGFAPPAIATQLVVTGVWNLYVKLGLPVVALGILAFTATSQPGLAAAAVVGLTVVAGMVALLGAVLWREATAAAVGHTVQRLTGRLLRLLRRGAAELDLAASVVDFRRRVIDLVTTRWPWLTLSTLGYHLSLFAVLWAALVALDVDGVTFPEALAVFAIARQLTALPITPGGAGVVELGLIGGLHAAGGELPAVTAGVLVFRFVTYFLYLPAGIPVYLAWRRHRRAATGTATRVPPALPSPEDTPGPTLPAGEPIGRYYRHPGDVGRLVIGLLAIPLLSIVATQSRVLRFEADVFRLVNSLPDALSPFFNLVMQAGWLGAVPVAAAAALLVRRRRLAFDLVGGGLLAWLLAKVVKGLVDRGRPAEIFDEVILRGVVEGGLGFISGHAAVAAALAAVASGHVRRSLRWTMWAAVWLVAIARVYVGAHLPLDVLGGVALGLAVGGALHLARGTPGHLPSPASIARSLVELGLPQPNRVRLLATDAKGSVPLHVSTADGTELFVKAIGHDQRDADLLFKLSRYLLFHELEDEAPFATPKQQLEHEAYLTLLAAQAGARVPTVQFTGSTDDRIWFLVAEHVRGRALGANSGDEVEDALLDEVWQQVSRLRRARIAHRDLRLANILVDDEGRPWIVDFGFAEAGTSKRQLARDVAELMASTATVLGPRRAVAAAVRNLGTDAVASAAHLLQPLALTWTTRKELRRHPGLLADIRAETAHVTGREVSPKSLVRVQLRPSTMVAVLLLGYAVHHLIVEVTGAAGVGGLLESLRWRWMVTAFVATVSTYVASAVALMAAYPHPLGLGRTIAVQLGSSFASKMAPPGRGTLAVNTDYLRHTGAEAGQALRAVTVTRAAGVFGHTCILVLSTTVALTQGVRTGSLPRSWSTLVVVAAVVVVVGLVLWRPLQRSSSVRAAVDGIRALPGAVSRPGRAVALMAGTVGVTIGHALALYATLQALGQGPAMTAVIALHLVVTALAVLGPLPGGLGLVEPALAVGLMLIGVRPVPAVVAVVLFRILSYWLPIAPAGWTLNRLRRRGVVGETA